MKQAKLRGTSYRFKCYCGAEVSFQRLTQNPQCSKCKTEFSVTVGVSELEKRNKTIRAVFVEEIPLDK